MKWDLLLPLHFPQVAPLIFGVRGRLSCQGWQQARSYLNGGSVSKGKQHQRFVRGVTSSVTGVELSVRHTGFKCAKWFPQLLLGCSRAEGTCPVPGLTCVGWRAWPWAHNPGAHPCSVSVPGRDPWAYSSHSGCSLLRPGPTPEKGTGGAVCTTLAFSSCKSQRKDLAELGRASQWRTKADAAGSGKQCRAGRCSHCPQQIPAIFSGQRREAKPSQHHISRGQTKQAPPSKTKANNKNNLCFPSLLWEDNQRTH